MSWFLNDVNEPYNIAILKIEIVDYCCIIIGISNCEGIKLLQNIDVTEKSWTL